MKIPAFTGPVIRSTDLDGRYKAKLENALLQGVAIFVKDIVQHPYDDGSQEIGMSTAPIVYNQAVYPERPFRLVIMSKQVEI